MRSVAKNYGVGKSIPISGPILQQKAINIGENQFYNCDETGLYYKMLPSKTLAGKDEHAAAGYKKNKDRVRILACGIFSGRHKLRLMCIGQSA